MTSHDNISPKMTELIEALEKADCLPYITTSNNKNPICVHVSVKSSREDIYQRIHMDFYERDGKFEFSKIYYHSFGINTSLWTFTSVQDVLDFIKIQQFVGQPFFDPSLGD